MKTSSLLALVTALLMLALGLGGCASRPGGSAPAGTPPPAPPPTSRPSFGGLFGSGLSPALEAQRVRLADALRGTPVKVEATAEHQLRVEVPTKHAFEPGRSAVKPALAAVLDQLATGFKPYAVSTEVRIAAPADDKAGAVLVKERGASTRDYLVARGVPLSRIAGIAASEGAGLEIVVSDRTAGK